MSPPPSGASRGTASSRPPNLLTVMLDCARAKNFAHSGGDRIARTPVIDSLAARGTAFPRAVAPANWTIPSHFSFFTGQYPNVHGIRTFQQRTDPMPDMTAMFLQRAGFETAMFTEMVHLVGGYGMEDGFEVRRSRHIGISDEERTVANSLLGHADFLYSARVRSLVSKLPPLITPIALFNHPQEVAYKQDVCGRHTLDYFDEWMRSRSRERPFYAFLNFVDAHEPYDLIPDGRPITFLDRMYLQTPRYYLLAVPGLQSHVRWNVMLGGYVRAIEQADAKIGQLLGLLQSHGELERTMIIVTADHGQSFGEMGNVFHGCGATDSITRVPLVVAPPSGWDLPRRVDRWVSLCEMDSWLKAASAGLPAFDSEGHAPFPYSMGAPDSSIVYCEGGPASDPNRSLRGIRTDQPWNRRLLAAYRQDEKFVLDRAAGTILAWKVTDDADRARPVQLGSREAEAVRQEVFEPYEAQEASRRAEAPGGHAPVEVELDAILRSWGYG